MLVELSMVEQRYDAVREVLDGATVTDVAIRYGVDRRTLHRWLVRYGNDGLGALADEQLQTGPLSAPDGTRGRGSHRPDAKSTSRLGAADDPEQATARAGSGPVVLCNLSLSRAPSYDPTQAPDTPARRLQALGAIAFDGALADRRHGRRLSEHGIQVSVVTGIDDHSRFCVIAKLVARATARPVCDALLDALNTHGIPEQILTDNGKVFTGRLAHKPANVLFDRICLNNGIRHLLTAPYSPTTTGKIERLHKTMRKEFFSEKSFETIEECRQPSMSGSSTTTTSENTSPSVTSLPSGASSSPDRRRSRSSTATRARGETAAGQEGHPRRVD